MNELIDLLPICCAFRKKNHFKIHCMHTEPSFFNSNHFMASLRAATGINYFNDKIRPNGNNILSRISCISSGN